VTNYFLEGKTFATSTPTHPPYTDGTTPLMLAAKLGKPNALKILLEHGASPSFQNNEQATPLHLAAASGCLESVHALLAAGAATSTQDYCMRMPLMIACIWGKHDMVSLLAQVTTRRDAVDMYGKSALHFTKTCRPATFMALLDLGWDPYLRDMTGDSPISTALQSEQLRPWACNHNFDWMTLWDHLAINARQNPLAIYRKTSASGIRMLLKRLPPSLVRRLLETENVDGSLASIRRKPLCGAARWGKTRIMEVLIDAGANINSQDARLGTPVIIATSMGHLNAVKLLVRRGAHVFSFGHGPYTSAVHAAASTGRDEVLQWLLSKRYTDQGKITNAAEASERETKPWSGVRCLSIPIGDAWKRQRGQGLWEYLLFMEREKKNWRRMVVRSELEKVALVFKEGE